MENKRKFRPDPGIKLVDQVRQVLRYHHYAYRTENTYCDWIVRYIKYLGAKKHPRIYFMLYRIPRCIGLLESVFRAIVNGSRFGLMTISRPHHSQEGEFKV